MGEITARRSLLLGLFISIYSYAGFPGTKKIAGAHIEAPVEPRLRGLRHSLAHLYSFLHAGASLDFGVFLCSNCSGAHRALGPTITRVKSANLDLWQEEWVTCMILGNEQLNAYWEGESSAKLKYQIDHLASLKWAQVPRKYGDTCSISTSSASTSKIREKRIL